MKSFSDEALAALEAGDAVVAGAVRIATAPEPFLVWSGYGPLTLDGETYLGVGDRGLASVTGGALGNADQALTLSLSGVDSETLALLDLLAVRRAPTVVWRLIFDAPGANLLGAYVFRRGRLDQLMVDDQGLGVSNISATVQGAARGLGRSGGRIGSDADQQIVKATDRSMKRVSYIGQKSIYWGGKPPSTVAPVAPQVQPVQDGYYY